MKYLLTFTLLIFLISCTKDDENDIQASDNYFMYKGQKHEIKSCGKSIYNFDENFNDRALNLTFTDKSAEFEKTDSGIFIASDINLNGMNSLTFINDKWNGSFEDGKYLMDYFPFSYFNSNYKNDNKVYSGSIDIDSGEISVEKIGSEYEFVIKCKTNQGDSIIGYYKGKIKELNYSYF